MIAKAAVHTLRSIGNNGLNGDIRTNPKTCLKQLLEISCGYNFYKNQSHSRIGSVEWELFNELSDEDKSSVSQQGYLRFKAWERSNQELVKQLETEAFQSIKIN